MFLLFASISEAEQIGLQLSLESVQSHLCKYVTHICMVSEHNGYGLQIIELFVANITQSDDSDANIT